MPNNNLSSAGLRKVNYRSLPALQIPTNTSTSRAVAVQFNTAMATIRERARTANIPVIAPAGDPVTSRNVNQNVRAFWTKNVRPIVVPDIRHA